jgi:hypothetical protein
MKRFAYDILGKPDNKTFVWVQALRDLDSANARIKELESATGGEYVIFDQLTQQMVAPAKSNRPGSKAQGYRVSKE